MNELPKALSFVGLALVPICCLGVPLLLAAGLSVAALALIGGITVAVIAGATAIALLIVRGRRDKGVPPPNLSDGARRS